MLKNHNSHRCIMTSDYCSLVCVNALRMRTVVRVGTRCKIMCGRYKNHLGKPLSGHTQLSLKGNVYVYKVKQHGLQQELVKIPKSSTDLHLRLLVHSSVGSRLSTPRPRLKFAINE